LSVLSFASILTHSQPPGDKNYAGLVAALVAPFSRGNVTIMSNDTRDNPVISPNWLLDPRDQNVAVAAYRRVRQIMSSAAMAPLLIGSEVYPGLNVSTDAQILDAIQQDALPVYHAAATNAMGMANDTNAVVDSCARVIGVTGLRVVDASALPFLPPGHPQATICELYHNALAIVARLTNKLVDALAEKISDLILNA